MGVGVCVPRVVEIRVYSPHAGGIRRDERKAVIVMVMSADDDPGATVDCRIYN